MTRSVTFLAAIRISVTFHWTTPPALASMQPWSTTNTLKGSLLLTLKVVSHLVGPLETGSNLGNEKCLCIIF